MRRCATPPHDLPSRPLARPHRYTRRRCGGMAGWDELGATRLAAPGKEVDRSEASGSTPTCTSPDRSVGLSSASASARCSQRLAHLVHRRPPAPHVPRTRGRRGWRHGGAERGGPTASHPAIPLPHSDRDCACTSPGAPRTPTAAEQDDGLGATPTRPPTDFSYVSAGRLISSLAGPPDRLGLAAAIPDGPGCATRTLNPQAERRPISAATSPGGAGARGRWY